MNKHSEDRRRWLSEVKGLVRDLSHQGLEEFEIVQGESRVFVRWETEPQGGNITRAEKVSRPETLTESTLLKISSPFAGIIYLNPSPREPFFVKVGDMVETGQVVALIEAMKLFNEIRSEVSGKVVRVAVQSGHLVESGQVLMEIEGVGS